MTVQLSDLATATSVYLHDQVDVSIGRVTGNLEVGESGTFTVRWTNAAAPAGVRLREVFLHLEVTPDSVALMLPPGGPQFQPRATADIDGPRLDSDVPVAEMFVFLPQPGGQTVLLYDSQLDVGESAELEFGFHAQGAGEATFSAHIHASVDIDDLFPDGRGDPGRKKTTVLPAPERARV
jgi:hypothetical protein